MSCLSLLGVSFSQIFLLKYFFVAWSRRHSFGCSALPVKVSETRFETLSIRILDFGHLKSSMPSLD